MTRRVQSPTDGLAALFAFFPQEILFAEAAGLDIPDGVFAEGRQLYTDRSAMTGFSGQRELPEPRPRRHGGGTGVKLPPRRWDSVTRSPVGLARYPGITYDGISPPEILNYDYTGSASLNTQELLFGTRSRRFGYPNLETVWAVRKKGICSDSAFFPGLPYILLDVIPEVRVV